MNPLSPYTPPRLCFVAHNAYGAIAGERTGFIGGIEHQQSMMARWFHRRGFPVALLTWAEGNAEDEIIDGVRVIKICGRDSGLPGVRFLHPRLTGLNAAMRRADADLYYQNCGEYVTGQVALWAGRHGRAFVYSVASDPDCDPRLPEMTTWRERALYRYGLKHAHRIIVQTERQRRMMSDGFGLPSHVLPMPCQGPSDGEYRPPDAPAPGTARVVWVARVDPVKRLEMLLDVAAALPEAEFLVAGSWDLSQGYGRELERRATSARNVTVLGRLARGEMPALYSRAHVLCCTSRYEGFPNTFLEAWSHGLPVVSTVDPDGLIASRSAGGVAKDAAGLAAEVRRLTSDEASWRAASTNARNYYREQHAFENAMPRFEALFLDLLSGRMVQSARKEEGS